MGGITGFVGSQDRELLHRMVGAIRHRGPDGTDFFSHGAVHLGMLSLDTHESSEGRPATNQAGDRAVVWNGRLYNHDVLLEDLKCRGYAFSTGSEAEVILRLYEEFGTDCVHHLWGMFTLAVADGDKLFLARDHLGTKPLYWAHLADRGLFLFGSEVKALLQCPEVSTGLNEEALSESLVFRMISGHRTLFQQIEKLEAGHSLLIRRLGEARLDIHKERYYSTPPVAPDDSVVFEDAKQELKMLLDKIIQSQMVASVEVGLLLSGGLDSGLLAAFMSEHTDRDLYAFTTATRINHRDLVTAQRTATRLGIEHDVVVPTFEEYLSTVPYWVSAQETLTSVASLSYLLLCKRVVEKGVKVCLHGEGSDSFFGGHSGFFGEPVSLGYFKSMIKRVCSFGLPTEPRLLEAVNDLAEASNDSSPAGLPRMYDYYQTDLACDVEFVDKTSMSVGLEVRLPFLDRSLVELANRLPLSFKANRRFGIRKLILRYLAVEHYGKALADAVLLPKLGFPQGDREYRNQFELLCAELLPKGYRQGHRFGEVFPGSSLLVLFDLFELIFVENRGSVPTSFDMTEFIRSRPC